MKQNAILHCTASGYPEPHIIWSKDGTELQHKGRIHILRNGTLLIRKAKKSDSGRYRCQARNQVGWIAREAYVHVYSKLIISILTDSLSTICRGN